MKLKRIVTFFCLFCFIQIVLICPLFAASQTKAKHKPKPKTKPPIHKVRYHVKPAPAPKPPIHKVRYHAKPVPVPKPSVHKVRYHVKPAPVPKPPVHKVRYHAKPVPVPKPSVHKVRYHVKPAPAPKPPVHKVRYHAKPVRLPKPPVHKVRYHAKPVPVPKPPVHKVRYHAKPVPVPKPRVHKVRYHVKLVPVPAPAQVLLLSPEQLCTMHNLRILITMTQNLGRALPNPCKSFWPLPIWLSAGVNIDGKWGRRNANLMGTNVEKASVNDAYINALAIANFWMRGFASVSVGNPTIRSNPASFGRLGAAEYSAAYSNNIAGSNKTRVQLEQAFVTIGDITKFPIFIQAGKEFQDYGRYIIHPINRSMTQVMSESLAVSGKLGWVYNGFNGSLFVLENRISRFNHAPSNRANYGIAVGFDQPACKGFCFRWDAGGAYLYNLIGVNDIAYNVVNFTKSNHYRKRVGGTSIYGDIYNGPFTLHARYTVAIQRFSEFDLPKYGVADFNNRDIHESLREDRNGAKPWSADFLAAYHFVELFCRPQELYLGYQVSRQAAGLNLPRARYLAGYNIDILHAVNIGIEWNHNLAYTLSRGGTGRNGDLVSLRGSVQF